MNDAPAEEVLGAVPRRQVTCDRSRRPAAPPGAEGAGKEKEERGGRGCGGRKLAAALLERLDSGNAAGKNAPAP